MPITSRDLYQHAFDSLRHASDFRLKIIGGWAGMYAAFAGLFVWFRQIAPDALGVVFLVAILMTFVLWFAEYRNRPAIGRAKDIGTFIENDPASAIPEKCRFFSNLDKSVGHGKLVNAFAIVMLAILIVGFFNHPGSCKL